MTTQGPLALALDVAAILDALGIDYVLGGSLASSLVGEPRSTVDVDLAVELDTGRLDALVTELRPTFYVPADGAREAVRDRSAFNVLHEATGLKVDLFVLGDGLLDRRQLDRRTRVTVSDDPPAELWVTSPEDQILRKLDWYRQGGESSDRQWRDVVAILEMQQGQLDDADLDNAASATGLSDLLARARAQVAGRPQ